MPSPSLEQRVKAVEISVEGPDGLSQRVAATGQQISQLQSEVRVEFSAVRADIAALRGEFDGLRGQFAGLRRDFSELRDEFFTLRGSMEAFRVELTAGMHALNADTLAKVREGDEETRRYMRVLHEDLIARIAIIGEAANGRRGGRKKR